MAKKPKKQQQSGGTPATVALTAAGVPFTVHSYDHDPSHPSYGEEAAEAMGVSPDRVFKTLVADVDGALTVAVVPVAGQLDLKGLAAAVGGNLCVLLGDGLAVSCGERPLVATAPPLLSPIAPPRSVAAPDQAAW